MNLKLLFIKKNIHNAHRGYFMSNLEDTPSALFSRDFIKQKFQNYNGLNSGLFFKKKAPVHV